MGKKQTMWVVFISAVVGGVLAIADVMNVQLEDPDAKIVLDKIRLSILDKKDSFLASEIMPVASADVESVCLFVDKESSSPSTAEDELKRQFVGRKYTIGYDDPADYAVNIAIVTKDDVRFVNIRKSWIDVDAKRYFFSSRGESGRCFSPADAVFVVENDDRVSNEASLSLKSEQRR